MNKTNNLSLIDKSIKFIVNSASDLSEKWAFVGSTASYLEGEEVNLNKADIDIFTSKAGAEYFNTKFKSLVVKELNFSDSNRGSGWEVKFVINGIEVEVVGDCVMQGDIDTMSLDNGSKIWDYLKLVEFHGLKVPIFPLEVRIITNAIFASKEKKLAQKAKFLLKHGYNKNLLKNLVSLSDLSITTLQRIDKYLPIFNRKEVKI